MNDITITEEQANDLVKNQLKSFVLQKMLTTEKYFYTYRKMLSSVLVSFLPIMEKIGENNSDKVFLNKIEENYDALEEIINVNIFMIVNDLTLLYDSDYAIPIENTKKYLILISEYNDLSKIWNNKSKNKELILSKKTYLMVDKNTKLIKIGRSINPIIRESTLQSEKPTIKIIYICADDIEKELHIKYKNKRIRGEWFRLTDDELSNIVTDYKFYEKQ